VPVPLNGIAPGDPALLLATEMLPDALPAAVGAKAAVSVAADPALMLTGNVIPLALNPAPVAAALDIVSVAFPEFVSVIFCVPLLPMFTFPKLTLVGLMVSCG
jgi:hypothetical protein